MEAGVLHCPTCGAVVSGDSPTCKYCGARLQTVACPSCFGMAFVGSKFCPHCGAELEWPEAGVRVKLLCPRCRISMEEITLGKAKVRECPKCFGLWIATKSFADICAEKEQQASVLGAQLGPTAHAALEPDFHYRPCPQCHHLMNRVNFAHRSGVIIDICNTHGAWFDRDELREIVEFIRAGGIDRANEIERENIEYEQERAANPAFSGMSGSLLHDEHHGWLPTTIATVGWILFQIFA